MHIQVENIVSIVCAALFIGECCLWPLPLIACLEREGDNRQEQYLLDVMQEAHVQSKLQPDKARGSEGSFNACTTLTSTL